MSLRFVDSSFIINIFSLGVQLYKPFTKTFDFLKKMEHKTLFIMKAFYELFRSFLLEKMLLSHIYISIKNWLIVIVVRQLSGTHCWCTRNPFRFWCTCIYCNLCSWLRLVHIAQLGSSTCWFVWNWPIRISWSWRWFHDVFVMAELLEYRQGWVNRRDVYRNKFRTLECIGRYCNLVHTKVHGHMLVEFGEYFWLVE